MQCSCNVCFHNLKKKENQFSFCYRAVATSLPKHLWDVKSHSGKSQITVKLNSCGCTENLRLHFNDIHQCKSSFIPGCRRQGCRQWTALSIKIKITHVHCSTNIHICIPPFSTEGLFILSFIMVDLFLDRVLVENNWDQDELNTEREIIAIIENRILMLFFASAECVKCQEFLPVLNDFFKRLKDPAYIEYPKLLALIYIRSLSFLLFISLMHWCECMNSHSLFYHT